MRSGFSGLVSALPAALYARSATIGLERQLKAVHANGLHTGYLARESARIPGPLLDDQDGPAITAVLAARPGMPGSGPADLARFEERDTVRIQITVTPRDRALR